MHSRNTRSGSLPGLMRKRPAARSFLIPLGHEGARSGPRGRTTYVVGLGALTNGRIVASGLAVFVCVAAAENGAPAVTPYRPSVSTPAALSAPGWLEVETGLQSTGAADPARRETLPYTLKLAFTPDWGVRIGGDALVRQRSADGSSLRGGGDTTIVLKRRLAVNDASAFGLELGVKLPTASWGVLLADAPNFYTLQPWLMVWPGLAVLLTTLAFNLLGDGLRDAFDPRATH